MTIYDIAKEANVSPASVSRVLNNKPGVGEATRSRILSIIEEKQFSKRSVRPSQKRHKGRIGIITDDPHSNYQHISSSICQNELQREGYQVELICLDSDRPMSYAFSFLKERDCVGALLMGFSFTNHVKLKSCIQQYTPHSPIILVRQTRRPNLDNVYCVAANEEEGISYCVNKLIAQNRKHLVLLTDRNLGDQGIIRTYFINAVRKYPELKYDIYADVDSDLAAGKRAAREILQMSPSVDGILCIRDQLAIGLLYGLQELGKSIPEDISLIGKDNSPLCEASNPPLTSLDSMLSDIVMCSISLLIGVLNSKMKSKRLLLDMNLCERETL